MTPKSTSTCIFITCVFIDMNFGNLSCSEVYILEDAGRLLLEYFHAAKRKPNMSHTLQQRISLCDRKSNSRLFVIDTTAGMSVENVKTNCAEFYHKQFVNRHKICWTLERFCYNPSYILCLSQNNYFIKLLCNQSKIP